MTDRDYFAAAALTRGMGVLGYEQIAKSCYEMADAMIRERSRTGQVAADTPPQSRAGTNHDALPEAIARKDADRHRTDKAASRPGEGTGNTPQTHATPVDGSVRGQGTLTDCELAAILTAADLLIGSKPGVILRHLLARLS
jgi:hypothetical protein